MSRTKRLKLNVETGRIARPYQRKSRRKILREFEEEYIALNTNPLIKL